MTKSEVYSWRLARNRKIALEDQARRSGKSLGALLDDITAQWLSARAERDESEAARQARLRAAVAKVIGTIAGGKPGRSEQARTLVRQRLTRRRAR
ncbi:MAG TPA: hypothetical protein VK548_14790 [Candidatus Acidoferrum sp.]|nr:hypothetical protein [Candidatus Acidoferrum sp.]